MAAKKKTKRKITRKASPKVAAAARAASSTFSARRQESTADLALKLAEKLERTGQKGAASAYANASELLRQAARATKGQAREDLALRADDALASFQRLTSGRPAPAASPPAKHAEIVAFFSEQHRKTSGRQGWNEWDADEVERRVRSWMAKRSKEGQPGPTVDELREQYRRASTVYEAETFDD